MCVSDDALHNRMSDVGGSFSDAKVKRGQASFHFSKQLSQSLYFSRDTNGEITYVTPAKIVPSI